MQKAHDAQYNNYWQNLPSVSTPIIAGQLNRNEQTVDLMDDRILALDTDKANQTDMLQAVQNITFDDETGDFTITFFNGLTTTIYTDLEKTAINFDYDDDPMSPHYESLVLTLVDGTVKYIDMSALITEYDFASSSTIEFTNTSGTITADILNGSVTDQKLQPSYLADITIQAVRGENAATNANNYKLDAEAWSSGTRNGTPVTQSDPAYHNNSKYWSQQANVTSLMALTDVDINNPGDGDALMYDSGTGNWINKAVDVDELGQTAIASPTSGQVLKYNGASWVNADDEGGLLPKVILYNVDNAIEFYKGATTINITMTAQTTGYAYLDDYGTWYIGFNGGATILDSIVIDEVKVYEKTIGQIVPDGSTVVPTDDIQTWLNCANIWDKAYTTIGEVLADSSTLSALIASNNAAEYMARSTTWASDVCADSTAMSFIGLNNYCSNALLTVSSWCTAICNSTYMESVLNAKVPTMTSDTAPSGQVIYSSQGNTDKAFQAFGASGNWASNGTTVQYIGYIFTAPVRVFKTRIVNRTHSTPRAIQDFKLQTSSDGTTWTDVESYTNSVSTSGGSSEYINTNYSEGTGWRLYITAEYNGNAGAAANVIQFYGRQDV